MKFIITTSSLSLSALLFSNSAMAIVNVEDIRIAQPTTGFSGYLNLGLSGKRGNTEKDDIDLATRLQWNEDGRTDFIVFSYDYSQTSEVRSSNKTFLHARHVRTLQPGKALEAFAQAEENEFARLSFRGLVGAGLRYTLIEKKDQTGLYLGAGGFYVRETLEEKTGLTDHGSDQFWRANIYVSYKHKLNDQMKLVSTTYYQPRLDDASDFRALEQAALQIKMTENLNFKLSLDISHDSRPPETVEKSNIAYSTGLNYRF